MLCDARGKPRSKSLKLYIRQQFVTFDTKSTSNERKKPNTLQFIKIKNILLQRTLSQK